MPIDCPNIQYKYSDLVNEVRVTKTKSTHGSVTMIKVYPGFKKNGADKKLLSQICSNLWFSDLEIEDLILILPMTLSYVILSKQCRPR